METSNIVYVDYRELERFMKEGFIALGVPEKDARSVQRFLSSPICGVESWNRPVQDVDRIHDGASIR